MRTVQEWLTHINQVPPQEIVLGLDRIKQVATRLNLIQPSCPVIIVGGTNGKGSCVATLEKIYMTAGYQTGVFTSPALYCHNELVRINGQEAEDRLFCDAYAQIEGARGDIMLTAFEFNTLAAFMMFKQHNLDVWILEVGLGGRLDAVNIMDADVSVITSIGIDHTEWLGETRELIAKEKAGIFRFKHPVVCGDFEPPRSLIDSAEALHAPFYNQGKAFGFEIKENHWSWQSSLKSYSNLPVGSLLIQNQSTALMTVTLLQPQLPISDNVIKEALQSVKLAGRFEITPGCPMIVKDVAHNPDGMKLLATRMDDIKSTKNYAVFSMLRDKDIVESIRAIKAKIDAWYVAPLMVPRGLTKKELQAAFASEGIKNVNFHDTIKNSYQAALADAEAESCVWVFGSFYTVAACG